MGSRRQGSGHVVIENYKTLKAEVDCEIMDVSKLKTLYNGLFMDTDYQGLEKAFVNRGSGWAEASAALTKVIEAAVEAGWQV